MSKTELYSKVSEALNEALEANGAKKAIREAVLAVVDEYLKPKSTRSSEASTLTDSNGNVIALLDTHSKLYLPATEEFFYPSKEEGKGINGLKRISRLGESITKKLIAKKAAAIGKVKDQIINGEISAEEGKAQIEEIKAEKPDFSALEEFVVRA